MIRLYLDSDVINNIHAGRLPELAEFIENNRHRLLIAYSQAHVDDKLPSKGVAADKFWKDIDFLSSISNNKMLFFDHKKKYTIPCVVDARKVLEEVEDSNELIEKFSNIDNIIQFMEETSEELDVPELGRMFKSLFDSPALNAIAPDWMQGETYKDQLQKAADYMSGLRNNPTAYKENQDLVRLQYSLPDYAGQWTENVVDKIDIHLKSKEENQDFFALVDMAFADKDKITRFSYYTTAYQVLNMIGYKSDEIKPKKNKGLLNHIQDAMHSFYGAHCDYFVVMDKKLSAKSHALYEKFGIATKLINPKDLVLQLAESCSDEDMSIIVSRVLNQEPVDVMVEDDVLKRLYRINGHWLDYFTHVQFEQDSANGVSTFLFLKMSETYSNIMFYDEHDRIIEAVHEVLGIGLHEETVIQKFRTAEPDDRFVEYFLPNGYVRLFTDGAKFFLRVSVVGTENERGL
jgi:hypothetical protein